MINMGFNIGLFCFFGFFLIVTIIVVKGTITKNKISKSSDSKNTKNYFKENFKNQNEPNNTEKKRSEKEIESIVECNEKEEEDIYSSDNYTSNQAIKGYDASEYKKTVKKLNTKCPSCHSDLLPSKTYDKCPHCGASLRNICPKCGLINHETSILCQLCYTKLPSAKEKKFGNEKEEKLEL